MISIYSPTFYTFYCIAPVNGSGEGSGVHFHSIPKVAINTMTLITMSTKGLIFVLFNLKVRGQPTHNKMSPSCPRLDCKIFFFFVFLDSVFRWSDRTFSLDPWSNRDFGD